MPTRGHRGTPPFGTQASRDKTTRFGRFTYSPKVFFCLLDLVHLWYVHDAQVGVSQCHLATWRIVTDHGGDAIPSPCRHPPGCDVSLHRSAHSFRGRLSTGQRGRDYARQGCAACGLRRAFRRYFRAVCATCAARREEELAADDQQELDAGGEPSACASSSACASASTCAGRDITGRRGVTCEVTSRAEKAGQVPRERAWRAEPPRRAASRCPRRSE